MITWISQNPIAAAIYFTMATTALYGLYCVILLVRRIAQKRFLSEAAAGRAVADDGTVWEWDAPDYRGPSQPGARIRVAENGDQRWAPGPWQQAGWANRVGAQEGVISFDAQSDLRREALGAALLFAILMGLAIWGTGRKAL